LASQPEAKGTAMMTAAVAVTNFDGRRRMALPHVFPSRNQGCRTAPAGGFSLTVECPPRVPRAPERFVGSSGSDSLDFKD
jgi:hypothetical protein